VVAVAELFRDILTPEVEDIIRYGYRGMIETPTLLRFGKVVKYERWHGSYIRIGFLQNGKLYRWFNCS
jgi:hypothetical protein